jgi:hypothetical protein
MEQPQKDPLTTLKESIKKFADSYKNLSPAGKAAFQKQLEMQLKKEDERTKKLYESLIEATKNEAGIEKTIQAMEKADRQAKHGV